MSRLTTIIICILLSAILGFFLLWPQYQKFSDEKWHVKEKEAERNNQEEYFAHVESLSTDLKGYEEQVSKIFSALPSSPDIPALLNFIANASSQNGISLQKITSFSTSPTDQAKKTSQTSSESTATTVPIAKEISIVFEVSGGYEDLKNFISTLEKSARIIEVESISLKKKEEKEENIGLFSSTFKIKAYYY